MCLPVGCRHMGMLRCLAYSYEWSCTSLAVDSVFDVHILAMQTPISVAPYGAGANSNISISNFTDSEPLAAPAATPAALGPASRRSGAAAAGAAPAGLTPAFLGGPHALGLPRAPSLHLHWLQDPWCLHSTVVSHQDISQKPKTLI